MRGSWLFFISWCVRILVGFHKLMRKVSFHQQVCVDFGFSQFVRFFLSAVFLSLSDFLSAVFLSFSGFFSAVFFVVFKFFSAVFLSLSDFFVRFFFSLSIFFSAVFLSLSGFFVSFFSQFVNFFSAVFLTVKPLNFNTLKEFMKCRLDNFSMSFILFYENISICENNKQP